MLNVTDLDNFNLTTCNLYTECPTSVDLQSMYPFSLSQFCVMTLNKDEHVEVIQCVWRSKQAKIFKNFLSY